MIVPAVLPSWIIDKVRVLAADLESALDRDNRMFLIDRDGRLVITCWGCQSGRMAPENLRALLNELL
jgi:hypothetical protein